MPISGNTEPGEISGQLEVPQQSSIQFSSAIPIKKRRFPTIQTRSPSPEEKASNSDANDSKNKQSSMPDGKLSLSDEKNTASPGNSDVPKTSAFILKKEVIPTNIELGQTNVDSLGFKPQDAKPVVSLGSVDDLRNKSGIMPDEKQTEPVVPERSIGAQTLSVKQEIVRGQVEDAPRLELSMSSMNVELSLGPKEPHIPVRSDKLDLTFLSLASSKKNLALHNKDGNAADNISSGVGANRSNWDLNKTMDVWEGSAVGNRTALQHDNSGNFGKSKICNDAKSALNTAGTVGLSLNKGKHVLDDHKSNSPNASVRSGYCYMADDSLGLKLATPSRELNANMENPLSDKLVSSRLSPQMNLRQVQLTAMDVNRAVKSEPIDENSKRDYSIGSCRGSNMGLSKFSSVKRELVNNLSLETALMLPSVSPGKIVDHRSMKSEVVEGNQEAGKCKDAILSQSVARAMQHQDSCASSSALPVPSMPEKSSNLTLPTYSELTKNGDLSNQSEPPFCNKESQDQNDRSDDQISGMDIGNRNPEATGKFELAPVDEHALESCKSGEVAGNDEEKINIPSEILEEDAFGSDSETQEMDIDDENAGNKEYGEYEDGEVREPSQMRENPVVREKNENLEPVDRNSQNSEYAVPLAVENFNASNVEEKVDGKKNHDETSSYEPNNEDSTFQKVSELRVEEKFVSAASDKRPDASGKKVVERSPGKDGNTVVKCSQGMKVALADEEATGKVIKEICSGENDSTLSKEEASLNDHDATKDSNNIANKSRIINLSRTSVVTTPNKTRHIPNRLPTARSGKERYSDFDGDIQSRGNRDEFHIGGPKKFVKDRVHERGPIRNSFMRGKGRMSGRFGSMRREWDFDHNFVSENYRGPSDFRAIRRKHAPPISDVDLICDGYGVPQDGGRRKEINDEFPTLHRASLRRISPGDRDGMDTRSMQMMRRIPRNMSPNRCADEDCPDMIGIHHGNKFMRHLSDDIIDPVYSRQQPVYAELDGQLMRGNRNFPNLQRNGYNQRIGSKSPVRSGTRSPGPWRSPNGPPETMYRMGRMRSPERACFRDEMINRRRSSPSYITRHPNDSRNVDSGRDHTHHRSANSNRRNSPTRAFPRNNRRADMLDSQEMGEGSNEYINGPLHPNKFHVDGSADERRNFIERRGPPMRPFRPMYGGDGDDFQFHQNDGPRPYRFCPDVDNEFVERGREFNGRVKHQPMVVSRRIRNVDEETMERAWHDDGYADTRMKRMRF